MNQSSSPKMSRAVVARSYYFPPFGNKLIQAGYIESNQLKVALDESRKTNRPLIKILEEATGKELSPDLVRQYKKHQLFELKILYGIDCLDPDINEPAGDKIVALIESIISIDFCRRHKIIPLERDPNYILVAMVDPDNLVAIDELNRIFSLIPERPKLKRIIITQEDYDKLLDTYYKAENKKDQEKERKQKEEQLRKLVDVTAIIDRLDVGGEEELQNKQEFDDLAETGEDPNAAPVVSLVNKILIKALKEKASDIHIEPQEEYLRVRYRKDGVLQQAFANLPRNLITATVARFKIMANLDIAERRLPQDGKIRRIFEGRKVDFRVSSLPSRYGEKIVLRILDNSATQLGLDKLISDQKTLDIVRSLAERPFGLILVTGPTGSGKSTSLYSVLAERNDPDINISTAEDPIEYSLPGITQVQVIREKGMDFAMILRAFLRQDPDVILVGETRDK